MTTPNQSPLYLVVYDISIDKERNKIDKLLHGYGFRVQKSVYECRLSRTLKKQLIAKLSSLNIKSGHVRFYSVNGEHTVKLGQLEHLHSEEDAEAVYFID